MQNRECALEASQNLECGVLLRRKSHTRLPCCWQSISLPRMAGTSKLLATDISNRVLEKARKGGLRRWPIGRYSERLATYFFMLRGFNDQQGQMKVQVAIQQMVEFRRLNLSREPYPVESPFDAILCRNVLIYF